MFRSSLPHIPGKAVLLALVLPAWLCWGLPEAKAQGKSTGQFMAEAVVRVTNIANGPGFRGFGYADGISIMGGWVNERASLDFSFDLLGGVEYKFVAGGDLDASDVDLDILDAGGRVVASDKGLQPEAIVALRPAANGRFTLRMTLFQSNKGVPCVCTAVILKKDGWTVPVKNLDNATDRIINAMIGGDNAAKKFGKRVDLRKAPNQWAFFGGVLRKGTEMSVINLDLGFGDRLFAGAGDNFAKVVHLELNDNAGRLLKRDPMSTPVSVLDFGAAGGRHGLRIINTDSTGPAVMLMAVFDIF